MVNLGIKEELSKIKSGNVEVVVSNLLDEEDCLNKKNYLLKFNLLKNAISKYSFKDIPAVLFIDIDFIERRSPWSRSDQYRDNRYFDFTVSTYIQEGDWDKIHTNQKFALNDIKNVIEDFGNFINEINLENLGLFRTCIEDKTKKSTINLATLGNIDYLDEMFLSKELLIIQQKSVLDNDLTNESKLNKKLKV